MPAETYSVIEVRHRGGGAVAGDIAGGIIGGIYRIARWLRLSGPYYRPYPTYPGNPTIAYCMSRFRSYGPYSMFGAVCGFIVALLFAPILPTDEKDEIEKAQKEYKKQIEKAQKE